MTLFVAPPPPSASGGPGVASDDGAGANYLVCAAEGVPATRHPSPPTSYVHASPMSKMIHEEVVPQRVGISVFGEMFHLDRDPDLGFILEHPKWSLLGYGETIREAEQLLVERGQALARIMKDDFPLELDDEGARFRHFVIRLLYLRNVPSTRP